MHPPERRPVIKDVARVAGVSVPTVSRVLNNTVPVSPEKRAQVLRAIEELGYRPNAAARDLVSGRRSIIAVIAFNTTRYGYACTLQGVEESARAAGYVVLIAVVTSDDPAEMSTAMDAVLGQSVAGVVVIEFDPVGLAVSNALPASVPVVAVAAAGRHRSPHPYALLDDEAGAAEATSYLLGLWHRTVHHLAIPSTDDDAGRTRGWRAALEAVGAPVPEVVRAGFDSASGRDAGRRLVDDEDVTAILCGNDELALGVLRALGEAGRSVPDDVSVVGFDDQPFAAVLTPALTTVAQDFNDLGRRAFGMLEARLRREDPEPYSATPSLVLRESSGPPPRR